MNELNNTEYREPRVEQEPPSVLTRSLSAGYWSLLDTIMQKVLIFGSFFITARLLTPADFGLIALAAIYPNLLDSFTAIAFDTALTQRKSGEERMYLSVVWTFNILRSFVVFILVYASAFVFARLFHTPDTLLLFQLAALPLLIQSFANIGQIYLFRELELKKIFIRDMVSYVTTAIVSVATAFILHTYWALFIGNIMGMIAAVIMTYTLQNYRPRFDFLFHKLKPLLGFSQWIFGQGLVTRLAQTLEDGVIGHFTNPASVGLYSKSKSLAYAPTSPLANIIGKIGFSALVATEGSLPHVREGFHKSFDLALFVAVPFMVIIWLFGANLVHIILGDTWMGVVPLLNSLVVVSGLNASILSITAMIMNAVGRPQLQFRLNVISFICVIAFLPLLVITKGVIGAAFALLATAFIVNGYGLYIVNKTISPAWRRVVEGVLVSFTAALLPILPIIYFSHSIMGNPTLFFISLILYGISYLSTIFLFGRKFHKGPLATLLVVFSVLFRKYR